MKLPSSKTIAFCTATLAGLAGCGATGVPSNTPEARPLPPSSIVTDVRGIQIYRGTNEPVPVSFDACRQLNSTIRTINRPPRSTSIRVRIPRNGSIGDAFEDALGDLAAATIENLGNAGNTQINRGINQSRIDQLDRQCTQQKARQSWAKKHGFRY